MRPYSGGGPFGRPHPRFPRAGRDAVDTKYATCNTDRCHAPFRCKAPLSGIHAVIAHHAHIFVLEGVAVIEVKTGEVFEFEQNVDAFTR